MSLESTCVQCAAQVLPVPVNGAGGVVVTIGGRPLAVMGFTVAAGRIVEIYSIADPDLVGGIAAAVLIDG